MIMNTNFQEYKLNDNILRALDDLGYKVPTKVQASVLPVALEGRDLIVSSQTGSGKTAAFTIPICNDIIIDERDPQALILAPTRELAVQISEEVFNIGRYKRVRCTSIYGKQPIDMQINALKQRVHVISGTPGRTLDHIERGTIKTNKIKYLVIDEADEMLGLGFIEQVVSIIKTIPEHRVTMLFSATIAPEIEDLCRTYMRKPERIVIDAEKITVEKIEQYAYYVNVESKLNTLDRILYIENPDSCILFCKTKENVDALLKFMERKGYSCAELHGGMLQKDRLEIMKSFKAGKFRFLVATDVAARGIDIEDISHVINYDVPVEKERYVHRIGRTGRAGKRGKALTLVTPYEENMFNRIQEYIGFEIPKASIPSKEEAEENKKSFMEKEKSKPKLREERGKKLSKSVTKLYINAGKDKKLRAGDIVGAITSIPGVTSENIGIIDVQDRFSYVDIMDGKGKLVLEALNNSKIKGKCVKVEKANK